jgi:thiol-disulfide isomerase/thioredoxin
VNDSVVCVAAAAAPTNHELSAYSLPSQPVGPPGAPMPQASATRGAGSSTRSEAAIAWRSMRTRIGHSPRGGKCATLEDVRADVALTVALAGSLTAAACGAPRPQAPELIPAASAAALPPLEYRLRSGEPWTARAALGRVLVLDVWATYCKPCRESFPKLGRLAAAYPEAVVIGLSVDEEDADVEAFLRKVPVAFPIARDPQATIQSGPLAIDKVPTVLVVDRRGRIRFRGDELAESDYDVLPAVVAALLAE